MADESGLEALANAVLEEMQKDPEKWTKTPVHYKKFKTMFRDTFGDLVGIYSEGYNGNRIEIYSNCFDHDGVAITYDGFNAEAIRKATPRQPYQPEEIEEVTRAALEAKTAYIAKYEATKAELSQMNIYHGTLNDIFPYIPYLKTTCI